MRGFTAFSHPAPFFRTGDPPPVGHFLQRCGLFRVCRASCRGGVFPFVLGCASGCVCTRDVYDWGSSVGPPPGPRPTAKFSCNWADGYWCHMCSAGLPVCARGDRRSFTDAVFLRIALPFCGSCARVHVCMCACACRIPAALPLLRFCARFQRVIFQRAPASSSPCPRLVLASGTAPRRAAWRRRRRCAAHAAGGRGGGVGRGWRDRMGHRVVNSFPFTPLFCIEPAVTLHRGCCGTGTWPAM